MRITSWVRCGVLCGALGSMGCTNLGFDVRTFPNPVLVGPVLKVADADPVPLEAPAIGNVSGSVKSSSASGASTSYEQRGGDTYRVERSAYAASMNDDIFQSLYYATGERDDVFVVVDALKAADLIHMSLFGYAVLELSVEGKVYERSALRKGGASR